MAVPTFDELQDPGLETVRIARERVGQGYSSSYAITNPISFKDISALAGGNSGGSGNSYPAINLLNPVGPTLLTNRRPNGSDPLKASEFFGYNQLLTRRVVRWAYNVSSSSTACSTSINSTFYYHNGSGVLPTGGDRMFTAPTGTNPAPAGYYQLFDPNSGVSDGTWVEVLGGGGGTAGTVGPSGSC